VRVGEYKVNLASDNLAFNYSKVSQEIRKYRTPDKIEITVTEKKPEIDQKTLQKIKILMAMIEKLTGKKLKLYLPGSTYDIELNYQKGEETIEFTNEQVDLDLQHSSFSAEGFVKTKDGKQIDFSAKFEQLSLNYSYSKTSGKMVDPLVLEIDNRKVGPEKLVQLDLNFDGQDEKFYIGGRNGFLVYDKNSNGQVDDASELLGPRTNDGFSELSQLDSDGNNWIDEDDIEFLKLKIWTVDECGKEKLVGLLDLNVGAIFLGNVSTPFDYEQYMVRTSGIYLSEDGTVGRIKQIDIKV